MKPKSLTPPLSKGDSKGEGVRTASLFQAIKKFSTYIVFALQRRQMSSFQKDDICGNQSNTARTPLYFGEERACPPKLQRRRGVRLLCFALLLWSVAVLGQKNSQLIQQWSSCPKYGFIENKGQIIDQNNQPNPDIKYLFPGNRLNLQIRKQGWSYEVIKVEKKEPKISEATGLPENYDPFNRNRGAEEITYHVHRIDVHLVGSNPNAELVPCDPAHDYINYYTTGTAEQGVNNVHHYKRVVYKDIYPNIDVEFMVTPERGIKYNFIVHPGGDYREIKLKYEGADGIGICQLTDEFENALTITTAYFEIREEIPHSYQIVEGMKQMVNAKYHSDKNGQIGMKLTDRLTSNYALVIDPVVSWATYYGESGSDSGNSIDADASGNLYVAGSTTSSANIATSGSHQEIYGGGQDVLLIKFNNNGVRQWGTYYGGSNDDVGGDVSADGSGNVYMTGGTFSTTNIATLGAHQESGDSYAGAAFIAKFNSNGIRQWGTYYNGSGGNGNDSGGGIATDSSGNVYITGATGSITGLSTAGAYQTVLSGQLDAFIVKFNSGGVRQWGTYYGGIYNDSGADIATDGSGNIYVAGTSSSLMDQDAFIVKFNENGVRLWGNDYGGAKSDVGRSITTDGFGNIYLTGNTASTNAIATSGAHQEIFGGNNDVFVVKFNDIGLVQWGTYYGGNDRDFPMDITTDASGYVFVTGYTASDSAVATSGAYQEIYGGADDAFVVKFSGSGVLQWGTYYGGSGLERGEDIVSISGNVFLTGNTRSVSSIATAGSHQETYGGGNGDVFIVKFSDVLSSPPSLIQGKVFVDTNSNCISDSLDIPRPFVL